MIITYETLEYDSGDGVVYSLRRLVDEGITFQPYFVITKLVGKSWIEDDIWDNEYFLFNILFPYLRGDDIDSIEDPYGTLEGMEDKIPMKHSTWIVEMFELAETRNWYAADNSGK